MTQYLRELDQGRAANVFTESIQEIGAPDLIINSEEEIRPSAVPQQEETQPSITLRLTSGADLTQKISQRLQTQRA